ncbi:extensin-like [Helianthus annuus]|uniref:extensin-like n=1 Tax=Helianthus annuus TaxID=4232 RepID=UPI000B9061AC|nr:extensin-like [Helianthus annuus]
MSVQGEPRFSSPHASSNYPYIPEDPQIGGPSNPAPVIDTTPATFAPPPPPTGFENPIPTYPAATGYNPFEPSASMGYNYREPSYNPYAEAIVYNVLYPSPFPPAYPIGYQLIGTSILLPTTTTTTTTTITTTTTRGLNSGLRKSGRHTMSSG